MHTFSDAIDTGLGVDLRPDQGVMAVMGIEGDTKLIWSRNNADEVDAARSQFDKLKAKGFTAYNVTGKDGERGTVMHRFDPEAERMIMVPAVVGG